MTAYNDKHPYEPDWQIPLGVWASPPTEDVHTQRVADCLSPLERIPKKGSQCVADCLSPLERIPSGGTEHGVGYKVRNKVMPLY